MTYSVNDIRGIMKKAPRRSEAQNMPTGSSPPEHYLQAPNFEEFESLIDAFLRSARSRHPRSVADMNIRAQHEAKHGYAITELGGLAVPTLVVYKPEGRIDRRYPFDIKTFAGNMDPDGPEFIVSTAYPDDLSRRDLAALDRRGLTIADVDALAVQHGWHHLRPLSLHPPGQQQDSK